MDLRVNQIKYIDYIKNFKTLQTLYLSSNDYFDYGSVSEIASLYSSLGEQFKNIDSKYNEYLSTSEYLIYKNLDNSTEEGQKKVNYLKNLEITQKAKVKYLDISGSKISNDDFNEILSGFDNLVELNCTGCTNLSTLNWVQGKTELRLFLFNDTAISGDEVSKLDDYATGLKGFQCNNSRINVTSMQETISRASCINSYANYCGYIGCGFGISELTDQLEDCTEITYLCTFGMSEASDGELDLSSCMNLTNGYFQYGGKVKLPSSFKGTSSRGNMRFYPNSGSFLDFENLRDKWLDYFIFADAASGDQIKMQNQLSNMANSGVGLSICYVEIIKGKKINFDLLSYLNGISIKKLILCDLNSQENLDFKIESWTGKLLELEELIMAGTTLSNLNFLENNNKLVSLSLDTCKITDISGLKCYSTLKNLSLPNNKITNLANISEFTALGGNLTDGTKGLLNLSNNPIYDEYNYLDENGDPIYDGDKPKKTKNIEELAKLKQMATNLNQIILLPNEFIKDFSPLTSLGWNKDTGKFN